MHDQYSVAYMLPVKIFIINSYPLWLWISACGRVQYFGIHDFRSDVNIMGFKSDSVLAFLLILIGAKAAEYFVSLEGDDDNSGTPSPETLAARQASS